jgi:hypothetical protein
MTSISIVSRLAYPKQARFPFVQFRGPYRKRPGYADLHTLYLEPQALPRFVRESAVAMHYLDLLGPLNWTAFPERDLETNWHVAAMPYAPFVAACLVKLDQQLLYMSHLRRFLVAHPTLAWVLGFPLVISPRHFCGVDVEASLPTQRHLARMLHKIPHTSLQFLLDDTVRLLQAELSTEIEDFGQCIAMDTKHILAWVKENNPKAYVKDRYAKDKQPPGDPDCRLGCKRKRNQRASSKDPPPTPADYPLPAQTLAVSEFYWGYASGVVVTKVPGWGEFVLAELTQPFDQPDVSYFHPLMADVEHRLGFRPRFGALDAAFDAFYVYEYFHREGQDWTESFAAVPFVQRGGRMRSFDDQGLPLCEAGLAMPLKSTFVSRTARFPHEKGCYVCPLLFPEDTGRTCPVTHERWAKGGCMTRMATSIGARLRYQIDRDSECYKQVYGQRTATERINAQAVALGIERPRMRNGLAITNLNTLIYVLINLRALQRVRLKKAQQLP